MSSRRLVSLLLLLILLAGCGSLSPGSQAAEGSLPVTAVLDEVQGAVTVRDLGQADFSAAANGTGLQVGGQVRTGADGRARLNLASGTLIRVGANSQLQFQSNQPVAGGLLTHLILQFGQVWISLDGGGVDIETPSGLASVRGSYMKVTVDPLTQDVWVNCLEGLCQAQSPSGTMDLVSGQGSLLYAWDAGGSATPLAPALYPLTRQDVAEFVSVNPECEPAIATANATASALPLLTPQFTATAVQDCFTLTGPANGANVPADDPVTFTWTEQPGRYKYVLTFTRPNGGQITLISWTNSYTKDMSLLPDGGTYQWSVTAYDSQIRPICTAGPFSFTKPASGGATPAATPISTPSGACVTLLTPADGAAVPASGPVDFTWSEYPGAYKYIITFYPPNTPAVTFLAWTPGHTRYMESFPDSGTYRWTITVKDAAIQTICTSGPFSFTKEAGAILPTVDPGNDPGPNPGGDLFWNRSGPGGAQTDCSALYFGVSTSVTGMIKVIYSTGGTPDGNVDPHEIIGNGPGGGSGILDFSGYSGQTIYYRFAVFNGFYTHDGSVFSFSCP